MEFDEEFQAPSTRRGARLSGADPALDDTQRLPRVSGDAPLAQRLDGVPPALVGMLLPAERVTFASRPHPIVLLPATIAIAVVAIALTVALHVHVHPIVRGHHVDLPWLDMRMRMLAWTIAGAALLRGVYSLAGAASYYAAYRVVTTNRRVFVIDGLLGRRVRPLGNTAMAAAALLQGPLGRILGFGSIVTGRGQIRDMRDPVRLYREFGAVANGVEGDQWQPAIRQTQIP